MLAILLLPLIAFADPSRPPAPRPNIILIVADDLGYGDVGYHGSEIKTPNIDALAAGGARLESFYVQPVCTQTRAALLTGRYPHRYGLERRVIKPKDKHGLPTDERMLPQALKEAGYRTAIVGKWHLGHAKSEFLPLARGFDYHYGNYCGQVDYFTHSLDGRKDWYRNGAAVDEPGYVTELIGRDAVRLIGAHDTKQPLFLYLPFTAPHGPVEAPKDVELEYKTIADTKRRTYAAAVTVLDREIGSVVNALKRKGILEQSLIIVLSDNGGSAAAGADNSPFRGEKRMFAEGGIRVPALAYWSGVIPRGQTVAEPLHVVDLYPTLLGLARAGTKQSKPIDGLNVWPTILRGEPPPRSALLATLTYQGEVLRSGRWKLIHDLQGERYELYDIERDPGEERELSAHHPDEVTRLGDVLGGLVR